MGVLKAGLGVGLQINMGLTSARRIGMPGRNRVVTKAGKQTQHLCSGL